MCELYIVILSVLCVALATTLIIGDIDVDPVPEPTTIQFKCLIVDDSGVSVHATLEVERDDVLVLITGDKWRFQRRMEE